MRSSVDTFSGTPTDEDINYVVETGIKSGARAAEDFAEFMLREIAVEPGYFVGLRAFFTKQLGLLAQEGMERSELYVKLSLLAGEKMVMLNPRPPRVSQETEEQLKKEVAFIKKQRRRRERERARRD